MSRKLLFVYRVGGVDCGVLCSLEVDCNEVAEDVDDVVVGVLEAVVERVYNLVLDIYIRR